MIHDWKMGLYWRLPVFLQEAALSLYARRLDRLYYGDGYEGWREKFDEWRSWSRREAKIWQDLQLQTIIGLAAKHVPFYREKWRKIDWKSVRSAKDLHILPLLDKQAIRQNESNFLVEGLSPRSLWLEKTSGTTGTSLRIYWSTSTLPKWSAVKEVMIRNAIGVGNDQPRVMMGGRPLVPGNTNKPPYWRYNRYWKQLYLSSYHVSRSTAKDYAEAIRDHGSEWITGYGSAIAALADCALEIGIQPVSLRTALVSGDTLLPVMRSSIENFFRCNCFDHYGQAEGVAMAMECTHGKMHTIPGVGIWEILREDGSPCTPGEIGEIAATGLINDAMPLVRYRLGDYAAWAKDQSCPCGNQQPVITDLEGRVDDYLVTSDGRRIGRLSTAIKRSPTIHSAQIVQDRPGHAYLLVRPGEGYRSADAAAVRDDILERIGVFDLGVIEVTEIPKTQQGKAILVIRLADRPELREIYKQFLKREGALKTAV
ncbi:MAG: phenylacetate--CoA ligase family protein [Candidatus Binatia bacterium]